MTFFHPLLRWFFLLPLHAFDKRSMIHKHFLAASLGLFPYFSEQWVPFYIFVSFNPRKLRVPKRTSTPEA